ncbi:MAG: segregation and condensation protein A [Candidatus Margulisiibacteriota bacterium]
MSEEVVYQVKVDAFEGPFDLLLKAIDEKEIDIYKVSISQIVISYFEYWKAEGPNLVLASDFVYMAAYLIELKSRWLLPAREETPPEESPLEVEQSLVAHIQEYKVYKKIAQSLKDRKEIFDRVYLRQGEIPNKEYDLVGVSLRDLVVAFKKVYDEAVERESIIPIVAEEITLEERIIEIKRLLAGRSDGVPFEDLFLRRTKLEIIVTFLAILELVKQRFILVVQNRHFGSILIFAVPLAEQTEVGEYGFSVN